MKDYSPKPRSPLVTPKKQSNLMDVLGSQMNEKIKLRQIMNKHMGYERPKPEGKKVFTSHPDHIDL